MSVTIDIDNPTKCKRNPKGRFVAAPWPVGEMGRAYDGGMTYRQVARRFGCSHSTVVTLLNGGRQQTCADPIDKWWLWQGVPVSELRTGESPADRAFRRFPITSHKPGASE